jgi:hypothetical protein
MPASRASGPSQMIWSVPALVEKLAPDLRVLESFRQKILIKRRKGYQVLLLAGLLCLAVGGAGLVLAPPFVLVGVIPFLVTAIVVKSKYFGKDRAGYENEYKKRVIGGITRTMEPGMSYFPERGLPESWFHASGLHRGDVDRYSSEDLFEGRIGKTSMWLSEVHAEDKRTRTDSKGRTKTYWVTIFKGLLVVADFHKHFKSEVIVTPDFAESTFGRLGRMFQKLGGNLEEMENPEFEKAFVVRATDPIESRYILTPDTQERMLALRGRLNEDVRFAFRSSHLYMTIPNKDDWFEPMLSRPAHDPGQMTSVLAQMSSCFQIVEDMNLNTRIWTKE